MSPLLVCSVSMVCLLVAIQAAENVIHVDYETGQNNPFCLSDSELSCRTVDYALSHVINNTVITIASGLQYMEANANVSYLSDIHIIGEDSVRVHCTDGVGLVFVGLSRLIIRNISFFECGAVHRDDKVQYRSGLYVVNSTNVTLSCVTISASSGVGLMLQDIAGSVLIENSNFTNNKVPENDSDHFVGGSGLYIELTQCAGFDSGCDNPYSHNNRYTIKGCLFTGNEARLPPGRSTTSVEDGGPVLQSFGHGGGLFMLLNGRASGNIIEIEMCTFVKNIAEVGGGLSIQINDEANGNVIHITGDESHIIFDNRAIEGGGGIQFGFFKARSGGTFNNTITFVGVFFEGNHAYYGGGLSMYSSRTPFGVDLAIENSIIFQGCVWSGNVASIGAAIALFPEDWTLITDGYLPTPVFKDCIFIGNYIQFEESSYSEEKEQFSNGGIIFCDTFSINVTSTMVIFDNRGSGMQILAGNVNILPNTVMSILGNFAVRGAGISLMSLATIVAHRNTSISFENNTASDVGGAIYYYSSDILDFVNSRRCFIRYVDILPPDEWNTSITFINNQARYGKAIYAESFEPCAKSSAIKGSPNMSNIFRWKPFTFLNPDLSSHLVISTAPKDFVIDSHNISVFPGIVYSLDLKVTDDLNQSISTILMATCHSEYANVASQYKYISDDYHIVFNGPSGTSFNMSLQTIDARSIGVMLRVNLFGCPPGYVNPDNTSCVCSVTSNYIIPGIVSCNESRDGTSHALLKLGYWAGCHEGNQILTAQCPLGYCDYKNVSNGLVTLPQSCELLNGDVGSLCTESRTGALCGECINDYSVYYHSTRFICGDCKNYKFGVLFYIISELVPLTIMFIVVIAFDVSVTSGSVNSFILFVQVLDFFQLTAFGSYNLSRPVQCLTDIYWFLFGFLNLDFFRIDRLSFCLWKGTTVLDVLAIKYLTSFCGLLLIIILFLTLNFCNCRLLRRCLGRSNSDGRYSIVHGISTFVVITYSQITKVSFQILTRVDLLGEGASKNRSVVFLSGNTEFFGKDHLRYAIPAIFVLTYAILLPVFLIGHPLYLRGKRYLLDKRIIKESVESHSCQWLSLLLTKISLFLKPILDAFQSCFKDDMRFFAGLFFFYRLLVSASFAFSTTAIAMYSLLELVALMMLTVNSIFQPYQRKYHNTLDTLMFADLAVINGISLFNFASTQYFSDQRQFNDIALVQVVLIYIPIIYAVVFLLLKLIASKSRLARYKLRNVNKHIPLFDSQLLHQDQVREEEERSLLQSDHDLDQSFTPENYPARIFETLSVVKEESDTIDNGDKRMGRDLRSIHGRRKRQYGTL